MDRNSHMYMGENWVTLCGEKLKIFKGQEKFDKNWWKLTQDMKNTAENHWKRIENLKKYWKLVRNWLKSWIKIVENYWKLDRNW